MLSVKDRPCKQKSGPWHFASTASASAEAQTRESMPAVEGIALVFRALERYVLYASGFGA